MGAVSVRCVAYIDGFNLYNGLLKDTCCKWLNLLTFCRNLRPELQIIQVKFFTALVERRTQDPDQVDRQLTYWSALDTIPEIRITKSRFTCHKKHLPLVSAVDDLKERKRRGENVVGISPQKAHVYRSEEKGSDVKLGVHLVHDAHGEGTATPFEAAIVITSDSDLVEAIRIVTEDMRKPVYVYGPSPYAQTDDLEKVATEFSVLDASSLVGALLDDPVITAEGRKIPKPPNW